MSTAIGVVNGAGRYGTSADEMKDEGAVAWR
jgi:hypothetical protein